MELNINNFTNSDCSNMDNYYHVFMYFYKKLHRIFPLELAATIASGLATGFIANYDLDSEVSDD